MKRIEIVMLFAALMLLAPLAAAGRTYSVGEVPNVHLSDRSRHVSNPDGILSPPVQAAVDTLLEHVRRTTTVEPAFVVVDNIDSDDIDGFATDLFESWGLGKQDLDNGLLVLVARDMRRAVIRPGYGLEGVLPDIVCAHILRNDMFPRFKEGDYDGGILAAASEISRILTDPEYAGELRSGVADADYAGADGENVDFFSVYLRFAVLLAAGMLILLLLRLAVLRHRSRFDRYVALEKWRPAYLALTFLGLGIPLVASLPLVIMLWQWRNGKRLCPNCGTRMEKVDEVHDNDYLTPSQDLEEKVGSVDYDVWLCHNCGETDILPYVDKSSPLTECEQCHARTSRLQQVRVLRQPTESREGLGERDYMCLNCGYLMRRPYKIAKLASAAVLPIFFGGGGGRGGFGGGGFSGGGFGGGHTGGGGASGGW